LITSEWAVEIFRLARARGLGTGYVSNGAATPEVLDFLAPWLDHFKVDLKGFDEAAYRTLGGSLPAVLETIESLVHRGIWCEVVTLLVPGLNDSDDELRRLTEWLASVSPDIPWHCTAFHDDYRMTGSPATEARDLVRAWEIGKRSGLRYVYLGNRPGELAGKEDTLCPGCGASLVRRSHFRLLDCRIRASGSCPDCGAIVPGRWARTSPRAGDGLPVAVRL
jgi:pyruvate formate lyase activating enzyme